MVKVILGLIGMLSFLMTLSPIEPLLADESYRVYRSAYFLGRGDTGIATADYHEAIYYNPAGLALGKGIYKEIVFISPMIEVSDDTKNLVRKVAIEGKSDVGTLRQHVGKNQHFGAYNFTGIVLRRAAIGAVASNQFNILVKKSPEDGGLEMVEADSVLHRGLSFSIAESFFGKSLHLGTSIKYLIRDRAALEVGVMDATDVKDSLKEEDILISGVGTGADIGLMFMKGKKIQFSLGLLVQNVGTTTMNTTSENNSMENLPQIVSVGTAIESRTRASKFGLHLDIRDVGGSVEKNNFKKTHLGVEVNIKNFIGVTSGLNQGYPTFGFFVNVFVVRMDLGMYTQEIGERINSRPDTRYFFRLMAGF